LGTVAETIQQHIESGDIECFVFYIEFCELTDYYCRYYYDYIVILCVNGAMEMQCHSVVYCLNCEINFTVSEVLASLYSFFHFETLY